MSNIKIVNERQEAEAIANGLIKEGAYIVRMDNYDKRNLGYLLNTTQDSRIGIHLRDKFMQLYSEWYIIHSVRCIVIPDQCMDETIFKFLFTYSPNIRPHLAECIEYQINNLLS